MFNDIRSVFIRVIAVILLISMAFTSESAIIFASAAQSGGTLNNYNISNTESEPVQPLLSLIESHDSLTEAEEKAIFDLIVPEYDEEAVNSAEAEQLQALMEFEALPEKTKAEIKILQLQEDGISFSQLNEYEKEDIFEYLDIRSDKRATVATLFNTLEQKGRGLVRPRP